jgi:hypothetical protein
MSEGVSVTGSHWSGRKSEGVPVTGSHCSGRKSGGVPVTGSHWSVVIRLKLHEMMRSHGADEWEGKGRRRALTGRGVLVHAVSSAGEVDCKSNMLFYTNSFSAALINRVAIFNHFPLMSTTTCTQCTSVRGLPLNIKAACMHGTSPVPRTSQRNAKR